MEVLNAVSALSQGVKLVKQLIPNKMPNPANAASQPSFGELMLSHQDSDGDGALTVKEAMLSSELFNRLDKDGNGTLSVDEINAGAREIHQAHRIQQQAGAFIETHDVDYDTLISKRESGLDNAHFKHIDQNSNAQLNQEEIILAINNRSLDLST
jgi:hypothetical protein